MVIKAQKQLVKQEIDRIGYDVQADEESKTQTVMDMLRKVPMVTVDGQDNILVKGNSSYKIYKNGHYDPSLSKNAKETFKSMPASMVKRIEVITDPGAREDAEGVDAILNIVMVDGSKMQGMTGVISATYNSLNHPNFYGSAARQRTVPIQTALILIRAIECCPSLTVRILAPSIMPTSMRATTSTR